MGEEGRDASLQEFEAAVFEVFYVPLIFPAAAHREFEDGSSELHVQRRWKAESFSGEGRSLEVHPTPGNCN